MLALRYADLDRFAIGYEDGFGAPAATQLRRNTYAAWVETPGAVSAMPVRLAGCAARAPGGCQ